VIRMKVARRPEDCPGAAHDIEDLFRLLFPQGGERVLSGGQQGWGLLAAQDPQLAITLVKLTKMIAAGPFLAARPDLREIAVQAVNMHFRCEFSYRSHLNYLDKVGLSIGTIAALPYWRNSSLFDTEQKLVIEYSLAAVSGDVSDELHHRTAAVFGPRAVAELALAVSHWSFWAIFLNAAQPDIDIDSQHGVPARDDE
jgi:alkylhydroperoxidase family enzyme